MALMDIYHSPWLAAAKSPSKPRMIWLSSWSACSWAIWVSSWCFWLRASAIWLASLSREACVLAACCRPRMTGHSDTDIFSCSCRSSWPSANAATIASGFCCQCSLSWRAALHSIAKDRHLRLFITSTLDDLPKTSMMQSIQLKSLGNLGNDRNPKNIIVGIHCNHPMQLPYMQHCDMQKLFIICIICISLFSIPGTFASCA